MPSLISETTLPNGMKIFAINPEEALVLYEQVQEYFKNGIELHPGDTIFDVGAILAYSRCLFTNCAIAT